MCLMADIFYVSFTIRVFYFLHVDFFSLAHTLSCNDDPCSHTCVERPDASGYECLCPTGKTLGSDQRTCEGK